MRTAGPLFALAASLAALGVANLPGIAQASTQWSGGLARVWDDGLKAALPNVRSQADATWKGLDQQEFKSALARFSQEAGKLRQSFSRVGEIMNQTCDAYRSYYEALGYLSMAVIGQLIALRVARANPSLAFLAVLKEMHLANLTTGVVGVFLLKLGGVLKHAGGVGAGVANTWMILQASAPTGALSIDFDNARMRTGGLPSFDPSITPGGLPPGTKDGFSWEEPSRAGTDDALKEKREAEDEMLEGILEPFPGRS